jgi:copper chaperone NosL
MRTPPAVLVLLVAAGALCGCRRERPWPPSPVTIHFGEDACAECKMIISDERHAAELQTRTDEPLLFDDLGCLLKRAASMSPDPSGVFARTADGKWLDGRQAWVVHSREISSPMGYGLATFATRESAEAEALRHGDGTAASLHSLLQPDTSLERQPGTGAFLSPRQGEKNP